MSPVYMHAQIHAKHARVQTYMAPWLAVFVDPKDQESAMYNNFRVFGTGLLCIMGMFCTMYIRKNPREISDANFAPN